jgi:hypothetical protein
VEFTVNNLCPKCHTNSLKRSSARGALEKFKKNFGWHAYRCRNPECQWRGLIKVESGKNNFERFLTSHSEVILLFIGVAVFSYIAIKIVAFSQK